MTAVSGLLAKFSVLGYDYGNSMISFPYRVSTVSNMRDLNASKSVPKLISRSKIHSFHMERVQPLLAMSKGGDYGLKFDDESDEDPFWLYFVKDIIRALKSLAAFLVQQPGQLKYIEWPSFQDTLRTATLTLVLVAMLIVVLSSIDSALSYALALLLRKPA